MSYEMNDLLDLMVDSGASDLHLQVGQPPTLRLSGTMTPVEGAKLEPVDTEDLMKSIASEAHQEKAKTLGGSDFGFAFMGKARFRVSVLKSKGNYGIVLRQIPNKMFGLREVGLPVPRGCRWLGGAAPGLGRAGRGSGAIPHPTPVPARAPYYLGFPSWLGRRTARPIRRESLSIVSPS